MPERLRFLDLILDYYGIDSRDKITQKQVPPSSLLPPPQPFLTSFFFFIDK